ncbi:hypothetical protein ACJIZ3_007720 [Penstemon smallii]|uniref:Pentatricopeptide repeat-containing protein n=1 Tax=Penstemon smallii TaxID=265156 RepID=A0ABD3T7S1_9LAMI
MIILSSVSFTPNDLSFSHKLNSCKSIKQIKQVHSLIIKTNSSLQIQQILFNKIQSLCISFSPSTDLSYIYTLFHHLPNPDISVYNDLIRCFTGSRSNESSFVALLLYRDLVENGFVGNSYTYPFVLKACSQLLALKEGQMVHASVTKNGFVLDLYVVNTLMRFYGVCGRVVDARKVFDESPERDLVSWTALIQGYVDSGFCLEGVKVFFDMCEVGVNADEKVMSIVLSACAKLGDLSLGKKLHKYMCNHGLNFDVFVSNALLDMYLKCGDSKSAHMVFNQMPIKNVVSWNSMIYGLSQSGYYKEALDMFWKMRIERVDPDEVTLVGILNSCANLGVFEVGKWVHAYVDKNRITVEGYIGNALIDMYAKCGSIDGALKVFNSIKSKDVYSYSTIIMGLAMHGKATPALKLFHEMCEIGIEPNEVTFISILTVCCHAGLLDEGQKHFANMSKEFNLKPQTEHYGIMVDLLGRAGMINEAYEFVKNMPMEPDKVIWGSLLGACRVHGKLELAERVMKKLVKVDHEKDGAYVLMSNIYASEMKWKNVFRIRKEMREGKVRKVPGCSSIELDGVVYEFRKGDKAYSKAKEVYMLLNTMTHHLYDSGYVINDYEYVGQF